MPSPQNINNSFFESSYKHAWKRIIPPGLTEAEVDFIEDVAGLKEGNKVLDIMCGYGRHAFEFARRGANVTAIDNLQDYIEEIQAKAGEEKLSIQAMVADVLHANFQETYDAVICMGNSFAFFNKEDALKIIRNVSSHLKPGGIFIINLLPYPRWAAVPRCCSARAVQLSQRPLVTSSGQPGVGQVLRARGMVTPEDAER